MTEHGVCWVEHVQHLLDLVAPDVFLGSGGGIAQAALAPVVGATAVAAVLTAGLANLAARSIQPAQVKGHPALILRLDGQIDTMRAVRIDNGSITGLCSVHNAQKLSHLRHETALRR